MSVRSARAQPSPVFRESGQGMRERAKAHDFTDDPKIRGSSRGRDVHLRTGSAPPNPPGFPVRPRVSRNDPWRGDTPIAGIPPRFPKGRRLSPRCTPVRNHGQTELQSAPIDLVRATRLSRRSPDETACAAGASTDDTEVVPPSIFKAEARARPSSRSLGGVASSTLPVVARLFWLGPAKAVVRPRCGPKDSWLTQPPRDVVACEDPRAMCPPFPSGFGKVPPNRRRSLASDGTSRRRVREGACPKRRAVRIRPPP